VKPKPAEKRFFFRRISPPTSLEKRQKHAFFDAAPSGPAVQGIAYDRAAEGGKVDADLVGTTGLGAGFKEAVVPCGKNEPETGKGAFAPVFINDGAVLFVAVWNEGQIAGGFGPGWAAMNYGEVLFLCQTLFEDKGKFPVHRPVFGKKDKPRSVPVNAVYSKNFLAVFLKQPVQTFTLSVPAVAPYGKAGRFVYREYAEIFVNDAKKRMFFHVCHCLYHIPA
jgi:hypothetical protein